MWLNEDDKNLIFFIFYFVVLCIGFDEVYSQDCESKETCGQCIQELECFWCISGIGQNTNNATIHCLSKRFISDCLSNDTQDPKSASQIIQQDDLSEESQISPQSVKLTLRKGEKFPIKFKYLQSANYPVDLYYIMDLSHSMDQSRVKLGKLGKKLAKEMESKTNNFKIGFGSFVDKLTLPYVNTHKNAIDEPCKGCARPYSFKNHLSLTHDADEFSSRVTQTQISGNLDTPEGGFDAMMQAMVCKDKIGWRPNSRHLLVLSTDAVSHIAGDGKLGGVIEPNDAQCHMKGDEYTEGLVYDYPSVSQINYVARQNNINIIFAIVTKPGGSGHLINHYRALSDAIENSKMATLDQNSDNVVKSISQIYDRIRDSVRITSNATKDISVTISSTCSNFTDGGCSDLKPGTVLDFIATIEARECVEGGSHKKYVKIKPEGLEDSLIVELDVVCDCDCAAKKKRQSRECSGQGDFECGICRCDEGRFGAICQCDRTESKGEDPNLCIKQDGKREVCSGQGDCICGKCHCRVKDKDQRIYGKYCECDNFTCPLKCSGKGRCDCGKCICDKGWTGPACECATDMSECMAPGTKDICSGHGNCTCGQCQCTQDNERHSGKYCEECTSCPAQRCDELRPCVECKTYRFGPYANESDCGRNCNAFQIIAEEEDFQESRREEAKKCRVLDENGCTMIFEYTYDDQRNLTVRAAKVKNCPAPPNILAWVLGVIGSVLLAGLIMLVVWKIVTTVHDKNEYAKFENERNKMKWHNSVNPLYRGATSTFPNPAYRRASQRMSAKNDKARSPQNEKD